MRLPTAEPELRTRLGLELESTGPAQDMTQAIGRLRREHREVLAAVYVRRLRPAEAANVLGLSVDTVTSRTYHAMRELRSVLVDLGVLPPTSRLPMSNSGRS